MTASEQSRGSGAAPTRRGRTAMRSSASGRFVSQANRVAAARGFIKASQKTGDPVPEHIRRLAQGG